MALSGIDMPAILIANGMGLLLLLVTSTCCRWKLREGSHESRVLRFLILLTAVTCVVDPVDFYADGRPGALYHTLITAGNTWQFLMDVIVAPCWIEFLSLHLHVSLAKAHKHAVYASIAVGVLFLIVNFFRPIVFFVDAGNRYARGPLYLYYMIMDGLYILDGLALYAKARRAGGLMKLFPVWSFVIPVAIGIVVQSLFYGVSTICLAIAISVSGILASLQNELIFRDGLTGLYNRFYLDDLLDRLDRAGRHGSTAMMLDLNGFKSINDTYGHVMGDQALKDAAAVLSKAVGSLGEVMRYAGDEFVILLNTDDEAVSAACREAIHEGFRRFNSSGEVPYRLSASIGCCTLDLAERTTDDLMNEIDRRMFEEKRRYYAETSGNDRRKRAGEGGR